MSSIHKFTTQWTSTQPIDVVLCSLAIEVTEFAVKHCFSNIRVPKTLQVLIEPLEASENGTKCLGVCENTTSDGVIPGLVTIKVTPFQTHEEFINTLFHEIVHAQQIFEGRLSRSRIKNSQPMLVMWNSRAFSTRLMQYESWPWEIEANKEAARLSFLLRPENAIASAVAVASAVEEANKQPEDEECMS